MERRSTHSAVIGGLVAAWLLRGVDLQHSDLAVQRTLAAVRRDPHILPGDLVADHAFHHPGLWLDLLALVPDHPLLLGALGLAASGLSVLLAFRCVRALGGGLAAAALLGLAVLVPRSLPGVVEVLPHAPTSRAVVVPLVLGSFLCVARRRPDWAGLLAGLSCAVHPAVGGGALLIVLAWSAHPVRTALAAFGGLVPLLIGVIWAELPTDRAGDWWPVVWSRWGHHLVHIDLWSGLLAGAALTAAWTFGGDRARPGLAQASQAAVVVMLASVLVAAGVATERLPHAWARLHPWHWWVAPTLFVGLRTCLWVRPDPPGLLAAGLVLLVGLQVDGAGWRGPPRGLPPRLLDHLEGRPPGEPILADPRQSPHVRLDAGRAVVVSVKDGAEVVADPVFARRWSHRLLEVCGRDALPGGPGPGWTRYRRACPPPGDPNLWHALSVRFRPAAMCLPTGIRLRGWKRVAPCAGGDWSIQAPPEPTPE